MGRGIGTGPFWWIIAATLTGMLGFGSVIPVLPPYLHDHLFATTFTTGFVVGMSSATALLGRLFAGPLADRRGRRITLMLGLALCGLAGLLYLPLFGVWSLTAARILHGLGEGFFLTAAVAWVVDLAAPHQRGQALGFLASGVWGGLALGPLLGQALGGLPQVAWFVAGASFLALAAAWRYAHEEPRVRAAGRPALFHRAVRMPGLVLGLANVPYATMAGFLPLLLRERGMAGAVATWAGLTAVFWMGLCSAALAAVVAWVARVE